ncbi:MAG TPA: class I SAM-dependent methyltransferase [Chitinophagaceae bacterium]|nr:class I SAM-dependent methyltransferase [Chitinophagaceae bacterium]
MYKEITKCRISGSTNLVQVLSLGEQYLTGVFPSSKDQQVTKGPVDMVWCPDSGLVQMKQSYSLEEMYGDNYGYRSGLNQSMVNHLQQKVSSLLRKVAVKSGDIILDIGSNDATSLKSYPSHLRRIGIDPTGNKFKEYYTDDIALVPDFFSAENFQKIFPTEKATIITSIAMFYDLEEPVKFAKDIEAVLADNGIWHFEQSYLPSMLRTNSYDTICQEHLEYYSLLAIKYILEKSNLKIIDVELNDINGGSFAVTAAKKDAALKPNQAVIDWMLEEEIKMGLNTEKPYLEFAERVSMHRQSLISLLDKLKNEGKRIIGYGASTKGNVLLQYCGIGTQYLDCIAEVNEQKFGSFTPGTLIPIVSEAEAKAMKPDYFFVLPWHFRNNILSREKEYRTNGGKFIFPLPFVEIV